ncbi:hypothetical protein E8E14_003165 [Neopestalotiopsis sp. 37M]|nr:hypothetical protein E8E14_003165 [Neopestalotiopsis sp. 37M]
MREMELNNNNRPNHVSKSSSPSSSSVTSRRSTLAESYADRQSASRNGVRIGSIIHGIVSLPFFLTRLSQFLKATRPQLELDLVNLAGSPNLPSWSPADSAHASYLPPQQEVHSLVLFWQTHFFRFPILSELQFRREYQALVAESGPNEPRKASPLADIILALCMQLMNFDFNRTNPGSSRGSVSSTNGGASIAGFQYYRRCQEALDWTTETPSITTLQCYIFSIVYLYEAGLVNWAQMTLGKAISLAELLGLQNEPPSTDSEPEKEIARRTWWSLYSLDVMLSTEIGRPAMIGFNGSNCRPPTDSDEVGEWLAPHYRHDDACPSWLGFQTYTLRLLQITRSIRSSFYEIYDRVVGEDGYDIFVNKGEAREKCAKSMTEPMKELDAWARAVPRGYYVPRKEGEQFSTRPFVLDLDPDPNILIHCQRQRLLLELQYHLQCMTLYQPFICFVSPMDTSTPLSDGKADTGLSHAIAMTNMIHQAVTTSEALNGVRFVFRWQKAAFFFMIGHAYTFPLSSHRAVISKTVDMAVAVIDMYVGTVLEAQNTAIIARALAADIKLLLSGFYTTEDLSSLTWLGSTRPTSRSPVDLNAPMAPMVPMAPMESQPSSSNSRHEAHAAYGPMTMAPTLAATTASFPTVLTTLDELSDPNNFLGLVESENNWGAMEAMWSPLGSLGSHDINEWNNISDGVLEGIDDYGMHDMLGPS